MANLCLYSCCNISTVPSSIILQNPSPFQTLKVGFQPSAAATVTTRRRESSSVFKTFAEAPKFGSSGCKTCRGEGAVECQGCKGTGKNKKNGNIFERWKCFDCQGFGLRSCPSCGKGGLTPEQRGVVRTPWTKRSCPSCGKGGLTPEQTLRSCPSCA